MKIFTVLLILLIVLSCDREKVEICRLTSISYYINGNPNLKVVIKLTRNKKGLITKIDYENTTYSLTYDNDKLSIIRLRNEDENLSDIDYLFTYQQDQINIEIKILDFPDGEFDLNVALLKNDLDEIIEKITKNHDNEVTWHEKYFWVNGNIDYIEIYYKESLYETRIFEYDNYTNPMNELGSILVRPEFTSRNNVILTSSPTNLISNYNYEYNSKGLPINYQLPIEFGGSYWGQLNYSGCE